jgi:hypothetical protein
MSVENGVWRLWKSGLVSYLLTLSLIILGLVVAWRAVNNYLGYKLRSMSLSGVSAKADEIGKQVDWVRKIASNGAVPSRKVNHSSIGSPLTEAKLLEIRRDSIGYESVYHRLPVNFAEIESVGLPSNWKESLREFQPGCQILSLASDSQILNCDGWTRPSPADLTGLVHSFDPMTERFYKIDGHVLLYVPPLTKGIAVSRHLQQDGSIKPPAPPEDASMR